jgi:TnpA family transposase
MDSWHATCLGLRRLPREVTAFEIEVFFQFSAAESRIIEERRRPELKLGLALQIGFLRMSGRLLDAVRIVPSLLWRHLGLRFGVAAPDLASLRAMYRRAPTLIEHQQVACEALGFRWLTDHHRRALVRVLREELTRSDDRERLLGFARRWLYDHRLIIVHERRLRAMIAAARRQHEAQLARCIERSVEPNLLMQWQAALTQPHDSGSSLQSWLWAPPAKHSSRQIEEMIDRVERLYGLRVQEHLADFPDDLLRRYARRLASRPPSAGALIREPVRSIETACFLRYCLLNATDRLLMMVRRRVADLWRRATIGADAARGDWAALYQELLAALGAIIADPSASDAGIRAQLQSLLATHRGRRPATRAQLVRERLIEGVRPVRSLLSALVRLPWQATAAHPVLEALSWLQDLYAHDQRTLPSDAHVFLGSVWREALAGSDREHAFCAFEVATLLGLRRALRNGTVWIDHSLAFRSREKLFIPAAQWQAHRRAHFRRLGLPTDARTFLEPLAEQAQAGLAAVAAAAEAGALRVDDELHLTPLVAEEEDPELDKLRTALDRRIGEAQLPELILAVDAEVRFSWIMLGREPRSTHELLMVYAGILAHGTALSAAETARMIPQLAAPAVRQAMRWAADERRLAEACSAVLTFMHRHPIATTWGRSDLASSDMMSLETAKRVWQARLDPRRQTPSIGIYSHVRDRWGIFHAQPLVLNDQRQAGAAIEGIVRHEELDIAQLAVDTHGHTDFAMALAKLLGFDLCPRLKALKDRHLFLPRGTAIPESVREICSASVDLERIRSHWDDTVHLIASVHAGHTSAVYVTARYGSASRGDPLYEAVVHLGRLLRTVFLCDYFLNDAFRRELLRVLNRGEAVNALKRAIYTGRVASHQAKHSDEMQAVADALSLLANIVMAWNTAQMQKVLDHWAQRRGGTVPPELIGRVAPTRTEGINLRGVFRFPVERYAEKILPSAAAEKTTVTSS